MRIFQLAFNQHSIVSPQLASILDDDCQLDPTGVGHGLYKPSCQSNDQKGC